METECAYSEKDTERLHSVAILLIVITGNSEMPRDTLGIQMGLADVTQGLQETLGPLEQQLESSQKTPGHISGTGHQCFGS